MSPAHTGTTLATCPLLLFNTTCIQSYPTCLGHAEAQLAEALRYKPEGCAFDSRRGQWVSSRT